MQPFQEIPMTVFRSLWLCALAGLATAALANDPTPPAQDPSAAGNPDPSAASSPHQREATGTQGQEPQTTSGPDPADASSPHQREATGMTGHDASMGQETSASMAMKPATPATFVKKAALTGLTEVELGRIALKKSQDPQVRTFAQRMVTDHGKANEELTSIADRKQLQVPKALDSEHQGMVQELSSKSGADFDAAYAKHMAEGHAKAVELFKAESKASDSDLSAFASKTLPTLEEHKKLADKLAANTRSASAESSSSNR
jgi:putative membrane protein